MVNYHEVIDNIAALYKIVGSNDFLVRDIPAEYRHIKILIGKYEHEGYLIKSGSIRLRANNRFMDFPTYRISSRFIRMLYS